MQPTHKRLNRNNQHILPTTFNSQQPLPLMSINTDIPHSFLSSQHETDHLVNPNIYPTHSYSPVIQYIPNENNLPFTTPVDPISHEMQTIHENPITSLSEQALVFLGQYLQNIIMNIQNRSMINVPGGVVTL